MSENYIFARELYKKVKGACKPGQYNVFLHKHLGDLVSCISCIAQFELEYKTPLHIILPREFEFLCRLFNVQNYTCLDNLKELRRSIDSKPSRYLTETQFKNSHTWDILCKDIFISIPEIEEPFIVDSESHNFFLWDDYISKFWAWNIGIKSSFNFSPTINQNSLKISATSLTKLTAISQVKNIVLLAPDAATAVELPIAFWEQIIEVLKEEGYKVVVNSQKYKFDNIPSTFELNLSLEEIVWLGYNCAYVFSLRSGLCDALVGIGERLYAFYPAMLKREIGSLNNCFFPTPCVNEILIDQWKISHFSFKGKAIDVRLQKEVEKIFSDYCYFRAKAKIPFISSNNKKNAAWWRDLLNAIGGNRYMFPLNNKNVTFISATGVSKFRTLGEFLRIGFSRKITKRYFHLIKNRF